MATGVQAVQLVIQYMGEPGQRYPIPMYRRRECPADIVPGQAPADLQAISDVQVVIVVNKRVSCYLPENGRSCRGERRGAEPIAFEQSFTLHQVIVQSFEFKLYLAA